jgi:alkylation response protein AidB-like acyl-CoA dehydrogenase
MTTALLQAAEALAPMIKARARDTELARRLPADLAETIARAGLFRMIVPQEIGGLESAPADIARTLMAVAKADASVGWCLMIGVTIGLNGAYMPREAAKIVYGDPMAISGGVFAPMGRAVDEGDHWRVSGRWQWASGSQNCAWLCGGAVLMQDGQQVLDAKGVPQHRMMVFPAKEAQLLDTWHVSGLQGTGSLDMTVTDLLVPKAFSVSLQQDRPWPKGALYAFPPFGMLALGIASVALGNAAGALETFAEVAISAKSQGSRRVLAERAAVQSAFAAETAKVAAARALLFEAVEACWTMAQASGEISLKARADLRLACTHAAHVGAEATRVVYDLAGGSAVYLDHPLQRRFRDAHVMTHHIMVAPATLELTGRVMLDLPTDAGML